MPGRRSAAWIKAKHWRHGSFPIIGWRPGRAGGIDALLVATPDIDGTLRYAGAVEWGLPASLRVSLPEALALLAQPACPASPAPAAAGVSWVAPRLTLGVRYQAWTADGRLRTPLALTVTVDEPPTPSGS